MEIEEIHNIELKPIQNNSSSLIALKNYVLFTEIDKEMVIAISKNHLSVSLDYISKANHLERIIVLDEISFEKLLKKSIELKTDKEMHDIQKEQKNTSLQEEDFSVNEFLKINKDILTSEESAPIVKFVNSLFYQAIKKKSSDIHIEFHEYKAEVKYRIDGILIKQIELDKNIMQLVTSRIKVISNLDINEKRIPQDGRTQIKIAQDTLDVRVSILPTFYGERVVMRILMKSDDILDINTLGFSEEIIKKFEKILTNSYGMILVTGPTGSGKSTTLHSLLHKIVNEETNIITIEDPIEYKSNKISQIQVNSKIGLTFAEGLKSILRQDPDIIMLGEIRDKESASIAMQAALTGHLVFSTLHTNRAAATISRLMDMGIEKFIISSSILAVLAQRLVRRLCYKCKVKDTNSKDNYFKAKGCKNCNYTGYKGRIAIGELLILEDNIKELLKKDIDDTTLMKKAIDNGMITIDSELKELLLKGITSEEEAIRVGFQL